MRFMLAIVVTMLATAIAPHRAAERRVTEYPGTCPNGAAWYFIESDSTSVTVGCQDPDYDEPTEEPGEYSRQFEYLRFGPVENCSPPNGSACTFKANARKHLQ